MTKPMQVVAALALGLALAGCPGSGAEEMLETAELEEKQDNAANARKIYLQILKDHPGTPQAETAQERLDALNE